MLENDKVIQLLLTIQNLNTSYWLFQQFFLNFSTVEGKILNSTSICHQLGHHHADEKHF